MYCVLSALGKGATSKFREGGGGGENRWQSHADQASMSPSVARGAERGKYSEHYHEHAYFGVP